MDTHGGWEGGGGGWYEKYTSLDSESVQMLNMVKNESYLEKQPWNKSRRENFNFSGSNMPSCRGCMPPWISCALNTHQDEQWFPVRPVPSQKNHTSQAFPPFSICQLICTCQILLIKEIMWRIGGCKETGGGKERMEKVTRRES
jgi:hypothetical protein